MNGRRKNTVTEKIKEQIFEIRNSAVANYGE